MPGFEMYRFVDVDKSDLDEFMYGICHEVFNNPLSTLCCGQTYCSDCIKSWIDQKSVCPMDRKPLLLKDLISPPKALFNLINKLQIKCEFQPIGCKAQVQLSYLPVHLKNCKFNPVNFCQICGLSSDAQHDCISILKLNIESINDEMTRLRDENSYLRRIIEIRTDMTDSNVLIMKSQLSKEMEEKTIEISKIAQNKCNGIRLEMARLIAQEMDKQFGEGWNCFVNHGSNWGSLVKAYKHNYIQFRMGSNELVIYRASMTSWNYKIMFALFIFIAIYYKYFN